MGHIRPSSAGLRLGTSDDWRSSILGGDAYVCGEARKSRCRANGSLRHLAGEQPRRFSCYWAENCSTPGRPLMSGPNIFHKVASDRTGAAANRSARMRSIRTALLATVATTVWGTMAFVLIPDTRAALLATILVGLATVTVRMLETD
jgi:hypothetical protein